MPVGIRVFGSRWQYYYKVTFWLNESEMKQTKKFIEEEALTGRVSHVSVSVPTDCDSPMTRILNRLNVNDKTKGNTSHQSS